MIVNRVVPPYNVFCSQTTFNKLGGVFEGNSLKVNKWVPEDMMVYISEQLPIYAQKTVDVIRIDIARNKYDDGWNNAIEWAQNTIEDALQTYEEEDKDE